jgi:hypothetical protein
MGAAPSAELLLGRFNDLFQELSRRDDWNSHIGPKLQKVQISGYQTIGLKLQGAL